MDLSIPSGSPSWLTPRSMLIAAFALTGLIALGLWNSQSGTLTGTGSTRETLRGAAPSEPIRGQIEGLTPALLLRISGREIALSGIDPFPDETIGPHRETIRSGIAQIDARLRGAAGATCDPAAGGRYICQFAGEAGGPVDVAGILLINGIARTTPNVDRRYAAWQQEAIAHRHGLWSVIEAKQ